jgi:Flp pilus assembly protein TadG
LPLAADSRLGAIDPIFRGRVYRLFSRNSRNSGSNPVSVAVMLGVSIALGVSGPASRFAAANRGNVAVMFAIACVPVIGFVGAAIDYSRANGARSSMQAALDSTALMLSKDIAQGEITPSRINARAEAYFTALYTNTYTRSVTVTATYAAGSSLGSTLQVNASADATTGLMKVVGFPIISFNASSTAAWGNVRTAGDAARPHGNDGWRSKNNRLAERHGQLRLAR